jgi:hypothetical protein
MLLVVAIAVSYWLVGVVSHPGVDLYRLRPPEMEKLDNLPWLG